MPEEAELDVDGPAGMARVADGTRLTARTAATSSLGETADARRSGESGGAHGRVNPDIGASGAVRSREAGSSPIDTVGSDHHDPTGRFTVRPISTVSTLLTPRWARSRVMNW